MTPPSVEEFAQAAREFCSFAEEEQQVESRDIWKIRQWLIQLIYHIPAVEKATHGSSHEGRGPDASTYARVLKRFGCLPFDLYRVVFDPHKIDDSDDSDEPVMGMLSDDLADIYRDLAEGLSNAELGHMDDACSDWHFSYRSHWARHAVSALMAIEIGRTDSYEDAE
jgi:hypothetical protein